MCIRDRRAVRSSLALKQGPKSGASAEKKSPAGRSSAGSEVGGEDRDRRVVRSSLAPSRGRRAALPPRRSRQQGGARLAARSEVVIETVPQ